jgi:hypothetical protein
MATADFSIRDIITVDFLKNTSLVGIDLTVDDGSAFPDELFQSAIDAAINTVESELGIVLDHQDCTERQDAASDQRRSWWGMTLDQKPLKAIEEIKISYGQYPETSVPLAWVNITSDASSQIALIPTSETLGAFNFNNSIPLLIDPITNYAYYRYVPAYFKLKYQAGFNYRKGTASIPVGQTELTIDLNETLIDTPNFTFTITDDGRNVVPLIATTARAISTGIGRSSFVIKLNQAGVDGPVILNWQVHTVPQAIIKTISQVAALLPLDIAGNLIAGAGIARQSLSIDGLSQDIATTASATSSGFGATIISYQKQIKDTMDAMKKKYSTVGFGTLA